MTTILINAVIKQKYTAAKLANFASEGFSSPTKLPTLVADAKPIDSGTTKNKLAILIAIK